MIVLPDTSLVWNFHALGRLDLVQSIRDTPTPRSKNTGWSVVIHDEVARRIPDAMDELKAIFGDSTRPTSSQMMDTQIIRENVFRKEGDLNRHHMGESETIAIWAERAAISEPIIFLTEDLDVVLFCWRTHITGSRAEQYAGGRRFTPVTTADVLSSGVASTTITPQEMDRMRERLRDELDQPWIGHASGIRKQMEDGRHPRALTW